MIKESLEITHDEANTERTYIRLAKEGDQNAFNRIILLYQKQVFRLAYGFFQDRDDAMEIVQETFVRLYRKLDSFDVDNEQNSPGSWINRIAYNICVDYYRKFKKQKVDMETLYLQDNDTRTATTRPESQLDIQRFKDSLQKSLQHLSHSQKKVFILKHYSGLKHHEISGVLNLSVGTIKSLYSRSIRNLKRHLTGDIATHAE